MSNKLYEIEGIDGSSKTTLASMLADKLGAELLHSPSEDMKSEVPRIRKASHEEQFAFYTEANRRVSEAVAKVLQSSDAVVDRYIYSTLSGMQQLFSERLKHPVELVQPDFIIYCHADDDVIERRLDARGDRMPHEKSDRLAKIATEYERLFDEDERVIRINTETYPGETAEETFKRLFKKIEAVQGKIK